MITQPVKILWLAIMAVLGALALGIQLDYAVHRTSIPETESIIRYFSYFTIQSNIFVTVGSVCILLFPRSKAGLLFSSAKVYSAITVYIIIVGLIYNILLRPLYHPQGWDRVADELLHVVIPIMFVVYWAIYLPKKQLTWNVLPWLVYPLLYGIFTLIRGSSNGYYPYPFLDALKLGYTGVAINFAGLVVLFLMVSLILVGIAKLLTKKNLKKSSYMHLFCVCKILVFVKYLMFNIIS